MEREFSLVAGDDFSSRWPLFWRQHPVFDQLQVCWEGKLRRKKDGRALKGGITDGYRCINLRDSEGRMRKKYFHVLVAETFVPNPHNHRFVLHRDSNRLNCAAWNLVWGTQSQNMHQMHRERRARNGEQELNL